MNSHTAPTQSEVNGNSPINTTVVVDATQPSVIEISPSTISSIGGALFSLWLKIGATILIARLLVTVWPVTVLFLLSLMLVATLNPLVRRLQSRLRRSVAITTVVLGLVSTCCTLLIFVVPLLISQFRRLMSAMPHYLDLIEAGAHKMGFKVHLHGSAMDLSKYTNSLGPDAMNMLLTIFNSVAGLVTVAVLTTYLLIDGPRVGTDLCRLLPVRHRLRTRQMVGEIGAGIGNYMRGQLITSGLAGLFAYVVLSICHVPEALALACLMAIADAIPMVGPLLGTVPAVLMALARGTTCATIVLISYIFYYLLESHVLVPRIYGRIMRLSSTIILTSILMGSTLMGILGALLAIPVAASIPVLFRYVQEWRDADAAAESPARVLP